MLRLLSQEAGRMLGIRITPFFMKTPVHEIALRAFGVGLFIQLPRLETPYLTEVCLLGDSRSSININHHSRPLLHWTQSLWILAFSH